MKTFQNCKKGVRGILWIILIIITLVCLSACDIIPANSTIAYTKDELIDLYWENEDELTEVAEIILSSDSLLQEIIDNNDDEMDVWTKADARHFSKEDWVKIVDLYKKIRPSTIERRRRGAVWFIFPSRKVDGGYVDTDLYYFENEEKAKAYKIGMVDEKTLEHLNGNWYTREIFFPSKY